MGNLFLAILALRLAGNELYIVARRRRIWKENRRRYDAVFFSWVQTSVRLCISGSQKKF